jgi:hypothetical protein
VIVGEQGSAKSTLCKIFRRLIDPSRAPLRTCPKNEQDLLIAAKNGWILVFDNVSYLSIKLMDAMCRVSTGGGNSFRELYTDDEESLFQVMRLIMLNTIADLPLRGDVVSRTIKLTCPEIKKHQPEKSFWKEFDAMEGECLGALLKILSEALKHLPTIPDLENSPRMADFAKFGVAIEKAMAWENGTFLAAYEDNRNSLAASVLEDPLTNFICGLDLSKPLTINATNLLEKYKSIATPHVVPKNPQTFSTQLRRLAPFLRARNIGFVFPTGGAREIKIFTLATVENFSADNIVNYAVDNSALLINTDESHINAQNAPDAPDPLIGKELWMAQSKTNAPELECTGAEGGAP